MGVHVIIIAIGLKVGMVTRKVEVYSRALDDIPVNVSVEHQSLSVHHVTVCRRHDVVVIEESVRGETVGLKLIGEGRIDVELLAEGVITEFEVMSLLAIEVRIAIGLRFGIGALHVGREVRDVRTAYAQVVAELYHRGLRQIVGKTERGHEVAEVFGEGRRLAVGVLHPYV